MVWQYCAFRQPLKIRLKWRHWCEQKRWLNASCQVWFCSKWGSKQTVFLMIVFFYDIQEWDRNWSDLDKLYVVWYASIIHVWGLPTRCHTRRLSHICGGLYIKEQLTARFLKFYCKQPLLKCMPKRADDHSSWANS